MRGAAIPEGFLRALSGKSPLTAHCARTSTPGRTGWRMRLPPPYGLTSFIARVTHGTITCSSIWFSLTPYS